MEGTRHERIALVVIAYIIGLTTGFIAFGVNHLSEEQIVQISPVAQPAHAQETKHESPRISSVTIGEDGLFALTNGYDRMLSANKNAVSASALSGLGSQSFYKIIDAEVSRDGLYVYYCQQTAENATTCDPFIYALSNDTIYPVKLDGVLYNPEIQTHVSSWSESGLLLVTNASSISSTTPWLLRSFTSQ